MIDFIMEIVDFFINLFTDGLIDRITGKASGKKKTYDEKNCRPVLKCSICSGEQVAGFKDMRTGKFEEVMLIRNEKELREFMEMYGVADISKEY